MSYYSFADEKYFWQQIKKRLYNVESSLHENRDKVLSSLKYYLKSDSLFHGLNRDYYPFFINDTKDYLVDDFITDDGIYQILITEPSNINSNRCYHFYYVETEKATLLRQLSG